MGLKWHLSRQIDGLCAGPHAAALVASWPKYESKTCRKGDIHYRGGKRVENGRSFILSLKAIFWSLFAKNATPATRAHARRNQKEGWRTHIRRESDANYDRSVTYARKRVWLSFAALHLFRSSLHLFFLPSPKNCSWRVNQLRENDFGTIRGKWKRSYRPFSAARDESFTTFFVRKRNVLVSSSTFILRPVFRSAQFMYMYLSLSDAMHLTINHYPWF